MSLTREALDKNDAYKKWFSQNLKGQRWLIERAQQLVKEDAILTIDDGCCNALTHFLLCSSLVGDYDNFLSRLLLLRFIPKNRVKEFTKLGKNQFKLSVVKSKQTGESNQGLQETALDWNKFINSFESTDLANTALLEIIKCISEIQRDPNIKNKANAEKIALYFSLLQIKSFVKFLYAIQLNNENEFQNLTDIFYELKFLTADEKLESISESDENIIRLSALRNNLNYFKYFFTLFNRINKKGNLIQLNIETDLYKHCQPIHGVLSEDIPDTETYFLEALHDLKVQFAPEISRIKMLAQKEAAQERFLIGAYVSSMHHAIALLLDAQNDCFTLGDPNNYPLQPFTVANFKEFLITKNKTTIFSMSFFTTSDKKYCQTYINNWVQGEKFKKFFESPTKSLAQLKDSEDANLLCHVISTSNNIKYMGTLINLGSDIDCVYKDKPMWCLALHVYEIAKLILKAGAKVTADQIDMLIEKDYMPKDDCELLALLIKQSDFNWNDDEVFKYLITSTFNNVGDVSSTKEINELLDLITLTPEDILTIKSLAVLTQIRNRVDNPTLFYPKLCSAIKEGNKEIVEIILELKTLDVNVIMDVPVADLYKHAKSQKKEREFDKILTTGTSITMFPASLKNSIPLSLLGLAIFYGREEIVALLLSKEANINIGIYRLSILDVAEIMDYKNIASLLQEQLQQYSQ